MYILAENGYNSKYGEETKMTVITSSEQGKHSKEEEQEIVRQPVSMRISVSLFWEMKKQAADERRRLYMVIEDALTDYLKKKTKAPHTGRGK